MNPFVKLVLFVSLAAAIVAVLYAWWGLREKLK